MAERTDRQRSTPARDLKTIYGFLRSVTFLGSLYEWRVRRSAAAATEHANGGQSLVLAACPLNTLSWKENLKIESTQQAVFVDVKTFSFPVMVVLGLLVQSDFQNLRQHLKKK